MPTDKQVLMELAERCEKAAGPDRELDREIADATGFKGSIHKRVMEPKYTASLDAAMTLVPENRGSALRFLTIEHDAHSGACWIARFDSPGDECGHGQTIHCEGNTPALALTAAALRARSQENSNGD